MLPSKIPDGSISVLVFNGASSASQFSLNWQGKTVSYTLPAGAVATFSWPGYSGNTFDVTAGPGSQTVAPGGATLFNVDVDHYGNDRQPVSLHVKGLPSGSFGGITPFPFTGEYALPIFTLKNADSGTFPLTVTGTQGKTQRSSTVQFTIGGQETPFNGIVPSLPGQSRSREL